MNEEQKQFIRKNYQMMKDTEIAAALGVSLAKAQYHRQRMGLKKQAFNGYPVGTIKTHTIRGVEIQKVKTPDGWIFLHVQNWEKKNGPIPEGHFLKCKSDDRMNPSPDNWELTPSGRRHKKVKVDTEKPNYSKLWYGRGGFHMWDRKKAG